MSALVACLVAHMVESASPEEALQASHSVVKERDETGKQVRETLRPLERYEHDPGGWTIYTTRLALLCLLDAPKFRLGVETVVRLGGDADTNGAVTGALLGTRFGVKNIPLEWLESLRERDTLLAMLQ